LDNAALMSLPINAIHQPNVFDVSRPFHASIYMELIPPCCYHARSMASSDHHSIAYLHTTSLHPFPWPDGTTTEFDTYDWTAASTAEPRHIHIPRPSRAAGVGSKAVLRPALPTTRAQARQTESPGPS
jgi:hypothetical protein